MKLSTIESEFYELSIEHSDDELIDGVLLIHSSAPVKHEDIFAYLPAISQFYLERVQKRFVRCNPNSENTKIQKEIGVNML